MSGHSPQEVTKLIGETLQLALREHQAGNLQTAEIAYRKILEIDPNVADAHHFLGMIAVQVGALPQGLDHLRRSVTLQPGISGWRTNLASVLVMAGQIDEAEREARAALSLDPANAEAQFQLFAALRAGHKDEEAAKALAATLKLKPDHVGANLACGTEALLKGDVETARKFYGAAVAASPDHPDALSNMANLHRLTRDFAKSEEVFRKLLSKHPQHLGAARDLAAVLREMGRLDEAEAQCKAALALAANDHVSLNTMGNIILEQGKPEASLEYYDRSLATQPFYADARANRALVRLLLGDFVGGLEDFEARQMVMASSLPQPWASLPAWNGAVRPGLSLLLHAEQGYGDAVQFVRYAPILAKLGIRVGVYCREPLARLLATVPGVDVIVGDGSDGGGFDARVAMMSLPYLLGTRGHSIPAEVPYLNPPAEAVAAFSRIGEAPGLKVGLVWKGSADHNRDRIRSCPVDLLADAVSVPGVSLFSLSVEADAPAPLPADTVNIGREFKDFLDTAGAIANLDLVVGIDTAAMHVAAALNKPTWMLLPYIPDWRWQRDRQDSPWYPSMRLFRQSTLNDWGGACTALRKALAEKAG